MTFEQAVRTCLLQKYADFSGRATRSEYWYFMLAYLLAHVVLLVLSQIPFLGLLFLLADLVLVLGLLVPSISAAARRLHDTGRSGWWQLIAFVPVVGALILIYFLAQEGKGDGLENLAG